MSNESEQIEELSARIKHLEDETAIIVAKTSRWYLANNLILQALYNALREIDPEEVSNISMRLEHARQKTGGDALMFEAIEDALDFFK